MRERPDVRAGSNRLHLVKVKTRRREQIRPVVILFLEYTPHQREAVRMDPSRRKPEHCVACFDACAVDQIVAADDPDTRGCEVEFFLAIDVGHLGGLAADEGDSRDPAHLGCPLDELGDLIEVELRGGHVIQHQQRLRAGRDHVVDAVGRHVGAAVAERPSRPRHDGLRPDRIHRRREKSLLVEGVEAREGAVALRAGRLDCAAQPLDHAPSRRQRNPGLGVRFSGLPHSRTLSVASVGSRPSWRTSPSRAPLGPRNHK